MTTGRPIAGVKGIWLATACDGGRLTAFLRSWHLILYKCSESRTATSSVKSTQTLSR